MKKYLWIALIVVGFSCPIRADDTEIYGGGATVSVEPNILLILDNSGSMIENDVPSNPFSYPYSPATRVPGQVYSREFNIWTLSYHWVEVTGTYALHDAWSTTDKTNFETSGYTYSGSDEYRIGSYLDYLDGGGGGTERRIDVAKRVLSNLIDNTPNVRFGLMVFRPKGDDVYNTEYNGSNWEFVKSTLNGGKFVAPCQEMTAANKAAIKAFLAPAPSGATAHCYTPLAEALANAGQYFAGAELWYSNLTHPTPINEKCQKNFIILMTDGIPNEDGDNPFGTETQYILSGKNLKLDNAYNDNGQYLDEVAAFLTNNDHDLIPGNTLGEENDENFETQNITSIYTIGFQLEGDSAENVSARDLLETTAEAGKGEFYTAGREADLYEAFSHIISQILETNATYVAPVVPVSNINRTYSGQYVYFGFFRPQPQGNWFGNIKKLRYADDKFWDVNNVEAVVNGVIQSNAKTYWSSINDGENVDSGGIGGRMEIQATRNFYTYTNYTGGTTEEKVDLTNSYNAFDSSNTRLSPLTVEVINNVRQGPSEGWPLGDILHSEPLVIHYSPAQAVIFVGSNDGMIHCFDESTGNELWAFIPPGQLHRLSELTNGTHSFFIDGSPVIYNEGDGNKKVLIIGERRGGKCYYVLDVTDYNNPKWMYQIGSNI